MKVGVVGGTGNISTSIVQLLIQQGHDVTCFNRGRRERVPKGARLIQGDRFDRKTFVERMQAQRFDAAIDMLCFTRDDALSSVAAFQDVHHFVQCSTVCTYGIETLWLPVTETHPLRPITTYGQHKGEADEVFMEAYHQQGFPVTILKPSTTYGPQQGMLRQIAWEFSWIDRIRKGKPIVMCDEGDVLHQHLHVDDAALGFVHVLGKVHCQGQIYNMVNREALTWAAYHQTAMQVLGYQVELISVSLAELLAHNVPHMEICQEVFAHPSYYSADKLRQDVPEFRPRVSLEAGMRHVFEVMDREGRIPNSDLETWEDDLIARHE